MSISMYVRTSGAFSFPKKNTAPEVQQPQHYSSSSSTAAATTAAIQQRQRQQYTSLRVWCMCSALHFVLKTVRMVLADRCRGICGQRVFLYPGYYTRTCISCLRRQQPDARRNASTYIYIYSLYICSLEGFIVSAHRLSCSARFPLSPPRPLLFTPRPPHP